MQIGLLLVPHATSQLAPICMLLSGPTIRMRMVKVYQQEWQLTRVGTDRRR